jgi:ribonuclease P protein component
MSLGEEFPARLRLRQRRDFLAVTRGGTKHHTRRFLVFVQIASDRELAPRIGITVTKKIGNAVQRNWIKRRVRETFRRKQQAFNPGLEMVWIAKRQAKGLSLKQVEEDFEELMARRGICDRSSSRRQGGPSSPPVTKGGHK